MSGKYLEECLACGGKHLEPILDLGSQPLANSFVKDPSAPEDKFPLAVNTCKDCFHTQLSYAVDPDLMFKNYLYVSGTSKTLKDYMSWFSNFAIQQYRLRNENSNTARTFLDIACNDGTQLDAIKKVDPSIKTVGLDPAENLMRETLKRHDGVCDYLNYHSRDVLIDKYDGFDIINAQNVFAHNADPVNFMRRCAELLTKDGLLFIQNSQADMIKNGEFDTIYHEHQSFWNASSISKCANRAGLVLCDRIRVPVHGISDLFIFRKATNRDHDGFVDFRARNILAMEKHDGLHDIEAYKAFGKMARVTIDQFKEWYNESRTNYPTRMIVGFGAAAKGMTFLNACNAKLDYIIDENPLKYGLYSPGLHIPIVDKSLLLNTGTLDFVPLAWNFRDEIVDKIRSIRPSQFVVEYIVTYFPKFHIERLYA